MRMPRGGRCADERGIFLVEGLKVVGTVDVEKEDVCRKGCRDGLSEEGSGGQGAGHETWSRRGQEGLSRPQGERGRVYSDNNLLKYSKGGRDKLLRKEEGKRSQDEKGKGLFI